MGSDGTAGANMRRHLRLNDDGGERCFFKLEAAAANDDMTDAGGDDDAVRSDIALGVGKLMTSESIDELMVVVVVVNVGEEVEALTGVNTSDDTCRGVPSLDSTSKAGHCMDSKSVSVSVVILSPMVAADGNGVAVVVVVVVVLVATAAAAAADGDSGEGMGVDVSKVGRSVEHVGV
jgi:hypothetical protein